MTSVDDWYRDHLTCPECKSIPRNRALMVVLDKFVPSWRTMQIHESSPVWTGVSNKLFRECPTYSWSYYDPLLPGGVDHPDHHYRNENIEAMTFDDAVFDIYITQDVSEHIFRPDVAIAEIARVLRPGGMHIFTVPLVREHLPSTRRARRGAKGIEYLQEPVFHGDPINENGTLVTVDWGFDIVKHLCWPSGMLATIICGQDERTGILGKASEVIVMTKKHLLPTI